MPSFQTSLTDAANKSEPKASLVEKNNGTGKNCLICGSFVHMTRNCPVSP